MGPIPEMLTHRPGRSAPGRHWMRYLLLSWVLGNGLLVSTILARPDQGEPGEWLVVLAIVLGALGGILATEFVSRTIGKRGRGIELALMIVMVAGVAMALLAGRQFEVRGPGSVLRLVLELEGLISAVWIGTVMLGRIIGLGQNILAKSAGRQAAAAVAASVGLLVWWWLGWGSSGRYREFIIPAAALLPLPWLFLRRRALAPPWKPLRLTPTAEGVRLSFPALTKAQQVRVIVIFTVLVLGLTAVLLLAAIRFDPSASSYGPQVVVVATLLSVLPAEAVVGVLVRGLTRTWTLTVDPGGVELSAPGEPGLRVPAAGPGELVIGNDTARVSVTLQAGGRRRVSLRPQLDLQLSLPGGRSKLLAERSGLPEALGSLGYQCVTTTGRGQTKLTFTCGGSAPGGR